MQSPSLDQFHIYISHSKATNYIFIDGPWDY